DAISILGWAAIGYNLGQDCQSFSLASATMPQTAADLLVVLERLGICPANWRETVPPGAHDRPADLAAALVQNGLLTAYQATELLAGRGDGLVLGAFLLLEPLGEGGIGEAFKARAHDGARVVALKRLRVDRLTPDQQRRFRREVKIAAQLDHANIVRGIEAGEANGSCYLVMEYIEGTDLARLVKRQCPLAEGMACDYAR